MLAFQCYLRLLTRKTTFFNQILWKKIPKFKLIVNIKNNAKHYEKRHKITLKRKKMKKKSNTKVSKSNTKYKKIKIYLKEKKPNMVEYLPNRIKMPTILVG